MDALAGEGPDTGAAEDGERREYHLVDDPGGRRLQVSTRPIFLGTDEQLELTHPNAGGARRLGSLVVLRDVTELRDAQASKDAFVGILSHELRTPITTIFGAAKMLQRAQPDDTRAELLQDVEAEADRLYRLVEDLLVLTRIERDSLDVAGEPVLLGPLVERVVGAERERWPRLSLVFDVRGPLPMVRGEGTYVEQILRNLVGNAAKYGPPDGAIEIVVEPTGGAVAIRVLDEGPGITTEEMHRVFDLLYRSPATAAQAAGSGIGLFVSRRLAQAMGGRIVARRRRPRGAEFVLELLRYEDDTIDDDQLPEEPWTAGERQTQTAADPPGTD